MKLKYSRVITCTLATLGIALAQASLAKAEDSVEVIKVSGTRLSDQALGAFSVIDRTQIEQINPASTIDLLRRLPHVDVSENGNAGGFSYLSIRGGEFNFTLVTIDGIAVNDSTNSRGGGFDFNQINPAAIERIEVYRGGVNTIYGGDAVSGLINIVTRDTSSPVASLEIGSDSQVNASFTGATTLDAFTLLASLSTQNKKVSSFEEIESNQLLVKGGYKGASLNLASLLTYNQTDVLGYTEDSGGEVFANPRAAEQRDSEQLLVSFSGDYSVDNSLVLTAQLSWLDREETIVNPGIAPGVFSGIPASNIDSNYERLELDVFSRYSLNEASSFVIGGNHRQQDGSNRGTLDFGFPLPVDYDFSQDIDSVYAEAKHERGGLAIEASVRYDKPDSFDSETSFRLGAELALNDDSAVFAVFNQGYKLPSFFALAHPLVGNSELQPERSDNFEVGFSSSISDGLSFSLVYFANKFEDLIDFDAALFTNVNRNQVDTSGLEFDFTSAITKDISFTANMRYLDIDAEQGVTLRKRPNVSGNLSLDVNYKASQNSLFVDFRDNYLDSSIATGDVVLGGHAVVGFSSTIELSSKLDLSVNLENVFAKSIEDAVGFIQDDVEFRVGLIYRL